jgi:hypothetical protein
VVTQSDLLLHLTPDCDEYNRQASSPFVEAAVRMRVSVGQFKRAEIWPHRPNRNEA